MADVTKQQIVEVLQQLLTCGGGEREAEEETADWCAANIRAVSTYEDEGVLTMDKGLVITTETGRRFYLTVVGA